MTLIVVFELREIVKMRNRTAALGRCMLIYVIVIWAVSSVGFFTASGMLAERYSDSVQLQDSDLGRLDLAIGALERIAESPIVGRMFIPELYVLVGGTERLDVMRLFPAHNQYLDYALRGGVQSAILLIVLVMWGICEGVRAYPADSLPRNIDMLRRYLGAFMVMVAIGSLFELCVVQSLSASFTWLCLGILARLHIERKKSASLHGYRATRRGAYGR
jgi:O-antigen ligase